ncbi:hypothetical protein [Aquimarina spongiae]|uniref:Receptor L domain-containing protein n=1 Tax=Aquimarina spongiae TaxID=570521 RepID=A0A1M6JNW3_9FLAO|nr:hypothetical protein [Aquimarina spongiae]SHJ48401.1 hypothetical protein SAMN04488508_109167 [Aquimarina spongiae]
MKSKLISYSLILLAIIAFSCNGEDGADGIDGVDGVDGINGTDGPDNGLGIIILSGDITNDEAATSLTENLGKNTHTISISGTTNLTAIDLSEISTLAVLEVNGNENLQTLSLPDLETTFDNVQIFGNPKLENIDLPILETTLGNFAIGNNELLVSINFPRLTSAQRISFSSQPILQNLSLPLAAQIEVLNITNNESLVQIDLPNLRKLLGLSLSNNEMIQSFSLPLLESTTGKNENSFTIGNNQNLQSVDFGNLDEVGGVSISSNPRLALFSMNNLVTANGTIRITNNVLLTNATFSSLKSAASIDITRNDALTSINFDEIEIINLVIQISDNNMLEDLSFPLLTSIGTENRFSFRIWNNDLITSIAFPNLENLGNNISKTIDIRSDGLEILDFNELTTVSTFSVRSNGTLTSVALSSIQNFSSLRFPRMSTPVIDNLVSTLINITPSITDTSISLVGTASTQALTDIETLRSNGNTVTLRD